MPRTLIGKITASGYQHEAVSSAADKARLDDMFAAKSPPQSLTDREYFAGKGTLADQFKGEEHILAHLVKNAEKRGYKPGMNDVYCAGLARDAEGDPLAFIPATGGRGHIKRVCEATNRSCEGIVNYTAPEAPPKPAIKLAEDLIERGIKNETKLNPDFARKAKTEQREAVVDKYGSKD